MFCKHCGSQVADGGAFCPSCGKPLNDQPTTPPGGSTGNQPGGYQPGGYQPGGYQPGGYQPGGYQPGGYQPGGYQPGGYQPQQPAYGYPMKWYKFLIYFALFASAVVAVISGLMAMTGSHYGGYSGMVYYIFPEMQIVDILFGIAMLAMAVVAIITRQKLAHFKQDSLKWIIILYVISMAAALLYLILAVAIVGDGLLTGELIGQYIGSVIGSIVMIALNNVYFKKRASLFVN